ncbi:hypothetical protein O6H91_22G035200 [Diphasiastrum complanatum]|uniref:Uncharacterized protein n=1 Tax=Diphasiastrum complanatum TaxID=34168 RepID=A0ACC2AEE1_DIPCM|nr:hypothetical protein O6H91_22G035200 [Diphasiastrum complanatum]
MQEDKLEHTLEMQEQRTQEGLDRENRMQQENGQTEDFPRSNRAIPPQVRKAILAILMAGFAVLTRLVHHLQQQRARRWEESLFDTGGLETDELLTFFIFRGNVAF